MSNSATTLNTPTGKKVYCASLTVGNNNILGTSSIEVNATGTITGAQSNFYFGLPITFNTSGSITLSGTLHFQGSTLTYTQGTVLHGSSTVTFSGTMAVNNTGLDLFILVLDGNSTFTSTGTFGWTAHTLQSIIGTHTYNSGATYSVYSNLQLLGTLAAPIVMLTSIPGSQAYLPLSFSAIQTVGYVTAADINSAGGQTIWDWQGSLSNTTNWNPLTAPKTTSFTF